VLRELPTIAYKELVQGLRNKTSLKLLVLNQVVNFVLLAWIDTAVRHMPMVIVDQDRSAESRELVARLDSTQTFDIEYFTSSIEQAREHIRAGRASAAVVVPPDYSRTRAAGGESAILALVDGSDATSSSQATTAIQGVTARMNLEAQEGREGADPPMSPHEVLLFNPEGRMPSFLLPGLLAILIAGAYSGRAMRALVSEREAGNLERLLMTPMSYTALVLGKLLPWLFIGFVNALGYIAVMHVAFSVPIRGSLVFLVVALGFYVFTIVAFGTYVAAGAKNGQDAQQSLMMLNFPGMFLSGYIFPLTTLPKALLPISYALPQTHFIEIMRGICLRGASPAELAPHMAYLVIAPLVLTALTSRRFAKNVML
jgi:ABC-2 type transport system permease protein